MNAIQPFIFDGTLVVRTLMRDGDPWFVAVDVCDALGIQNTTQAVENLDEDERMTLSGTENDPMPNIGSIRQRGGARSLNIISESGVYALIFRSNKPEARRFRKWITSEVLPSIRKTGGYFLAPGSETTHLIAETEREIGELADRMRAITLEIRRLKKRKDRLTAPHRLAPLAKAMRKPLALTAGMILQEIPDEGIKVTDLERRVTSVRMVSRAQFYRVWKSIKDTNQVNRGADGLIREGGVA